MDIGVFVCGLSYCKGFFGIMILTSWYPWMDSKRAFWYWRFNASSIEMVCSCLCSYACKAPIALLTVIWSCSIIRATSLGLLLNRKGKISFSSLSFRITSFRGHVLIGEYSIFISFMELVSGSWLWESLRFSCIFRNKSNHCYGQ